jgi:hypothetical protein
VGLDELEVRWPDGMVSRIATLSPNILLTVKREAEENFTLVAGP